MNWPDIALLDIAGKELMINLIYLVVAYLLAIPIGWDRESEEKSAGIRTFSLVSIASCAYTITGIHSLTSTDAEARVIQALITGMGFIGGGAILKVQEKSKVTGTATAASLWIAGAIGMSVALNMLEIAIVLSLMTFLTLRLIPAFSSSER